MSCISVHARLNEILPPEKWLKFPVLVAVSGGSDSVALLRLLHEQVLQDRSSDGHSDRCLVVGHVNHGLRGAESNRDEAFVCELANELGLEFLVTHREPSGVASGSVGSAVALDAAGSDSASASEEDLRGYRYAELLKMAGKVHARYIATGHTMDDQAETILFRILRGTGLAGLAGIPSIRVVDDSVSIVRPLLKVSGAELEGVLQELGQEVRTDGSNLSSQYTRNFLRREILPALQGRFGGDVADALVRLGRQAAEAEGWMDDQAIGLRDVVDFCAEDRVEINRSGLRGQRPILLRQFFRQIWQQQQWPLSSMTFEWWQTLAVKTAGDRREDGSVVPDGPSSDLERGVVMILPGKIRVEISTDRIVLSR